MSAMYSTASSAYSSAPNSMGVGPRQRRTKRRAPVPNNQSGPWRDSSWVQSFSSQGPSPLGNPQDLNPAFALRKIVLLLEKEKYVDVSQLINQLNNVTIKSVLHELPIHTFIENIPDSLVAVESLYSKLFVLDPESFPVEKLAIEATVFQIVRHLALADSMLDGGSYEANDETNKSIRNILQIVLFVKPDIVSVVHARKKMMDNALQGIGEHSLVKVAGSLMNLHDGLKIEFEKTTASYKTAIQQLEQLSLSNPKPVTLKSFANRSLPSANHQVLMTYTEGEIQERLFKNKTVLNAVESNMTSQLPHLIQNLKERIENDKNALLAFGRLRREIKGIAGDAKVAPVLTQYSKSLRSVLEVFKVLLEEQYPEKKTQNLNFSDHDDQVLKLEDVEGVPSKDSANLDADRSNSTDFYAGISDADIPPPPNYSPPPIPPMTPPTSPHSETEMGNSSMPSKEVQRRRARSRDRSRRKKAPKSRATSLDRSQVVISRPERESVEDSRDFQVMMKRINSVSASSPAIGRRGLEKRGISPMRNGARSGSVSPSSYRRHLLGEDMPLSELSQRPEIEKDQLKGESRRSSLSSTSDIHKSTNSSRRQARPTSMYVTGSVSPDGDDTYSMLMDESSKREAVEKERDKVIRMHYQAQTELHKTKEDLHTALEKISRLQENERRLNQEVTKLSSHPGLTNNNDANVVKSKRTIVGDLLYEYDKLFTNDRAEAWVSLNLMSEQKQFEDSDDLKDKVLFSVIVLAFRTAKNTLESIQGGVQQLLMNSNKQTNGEAGGNHGNNQSKQKTNGELLQFLRRLGEGYDLSPLVKDVGKQLFTALYDYPKLKTSAELGSFIERCVSLAWRLTIQDPPLTITYDNMTFTQDVHQRAPATNKRSTTIRSYLWPCLVEESTGMCVYKGVVLT
ncbi:uncharacterized protein LOC121425637 isoform X3 [Lytechinus variegatus]|uniref:uncharacterized protein LOC121425637 isoform X3 n=1 Tax=Lytechinus variegatus TaxID=7654 RepID=UPI001BB297C5|nr:uncharacterized protein LOC121425637 isoform X3 [Lytechinus variegatus]